MGKLYITVEYFYHIYPTIYEFVSPSTVKEPLIKSLKKILNGRKEEIVTAGKRLSLWSSSTSKNYENGSLHCPHYEFKLTFINTDYQTNTLFNLSKICSVIFIFWYTDKAI